MPLLRQVSRAEIDDEDIRAHFQRTFGDRDPIKEPGTGTGTPGNWWTTFALAPDVLRNSAELLVLAADPEAALSIAPQYRELGVLRQAWVSSCRFIYSQHCKFARQHAGLSAEKIAAISHWQVSDLFDPLERALLAYTDALVSEHGRVDPAVISRSPTTSDRQGDSRILLRHCAVHGPWNPHQGTSTRIRRRRRSRRRRPRPPASGDSS